LSALPMMPHSIVVGRGFMGFDALEIAVRIPAVLRRALEQLRLQDRELAEQLRRAVNSVALNVSEGARRDGRERLQFFRIAAGSASEARTALELAAGWGHLKADDISDGRDLLDRELAILWRLTHRS
jgi:four helix bundle protein